MPANNMTASAAGAASAKQMWSEEWARERQSPFEQRVARFVNRRLSALGRVTMPINGQRLDLVEYFPGGETGYGWLKVETGEDQPKIIEVGEAMFELLWAKIINE